MFVVTSDPQFTHTVTAMVPIDGGYEKQPFKVTYRAIGDEETDAFDLNTTKGSTDFLRRIVVRLDDLLDANKEAIPYSDAVRDQVLALPWARKAITRGYIEAVNKAAEGN